VASVVDVVVAAHVKLCHQTSFLSDLRIFQKMQPKQKKRERPNLHSIQKIAQKNVFISKRKTLEKHFFFNLIKQFFLRVT
jgi:hypothetical protein